MMKKRILKFAVACAALFALCVTARTADIADSGECGKNVAWTLGNDGVLTISGVGKMDNWDASHHSPWYENSNIFTVIINDGVTSIGNEAFSWLTRLTSVTIPDSVASIGEYAFFRCYNLKSASIPDSVTSIGEGAFWGCAGLASAAIPDGAASISDSTFSGCAGLTSVTIPDSVASIGEYAFSGCLRLTDVAIPDSVASISGYAFGDCAALTNAEIPNGVAAIPDGMFSGCAALASVAIPDSVTSIGYLAFYNCQSLKSVTIPDSVTSINGDAFFDCQNLTDVYYGGSAAQWDEIRFWGLDGANIHFNAQDVGVGITLTDERGQAVGTNGQAGEKNAFQSGNELTASFEIVNPDAPSIPSELVAANVFAIFYDKDGMMVSLQQWEMDLSDPLNIFFVQAIRIPQGAKKMKILMLNDDFGPLRAQRLIQSSADDGA